MKMQMLIKRIKFIVRYYTAVLYTVAQPYYFFNAQPPAKQLGGWHLIKHMYSVTNTLGVQFPSLYVKLNHRRVVSGAQQASTPFPHHEHLSLELPSPPVTNRGLDKWQVVLRSAPIHRHAELHLDTLLPSGGGVEERGRNVKAGRSAGCQNISRTGKQEWHKELHSCLYVLLKGGFVSRRTWMEEIAVKSPSQNKHLDK